MTSSSGVELQEVHPQEPSPNGVYGGPPVPTGSGLAPTPPLAAGAAGPPGPPSGVGPRLPRPETVWVTLQPDYPDFALRVLLDLSWRTLTDLSSGDPERAFTAARRVILEHNGWLDPDGAPLPPPAEDGFWDQVPAPMLAAALRAIGEAVSRPPASAQTRRPT